MLSKPIITAAAVAALLVATPVFAVTAAANVSITELDGNGDTVTSLAGITTVTGLQGYATGYNSPAGPTLATSLASGGVVASGQARASLYYNFSIYLPLVSIATTVGVQQTASVPLLISYAGFTALDGSGQARASIDMRNGLGTFFSEAGNCEIDDPSGCGAFGGAKVPVDFTWFSYSGGGTPYQSLTGEIELGSLASLWSGGNSAYARIDPIIEIDPDYLAAHPGATITTEEVTLADGPPGAVPEPTTWAMMIGGFGMVGAGMRARRRKGVLA